MANTTEIDVLILNIEFDQISTFDILSNTDVLEINFSIAPDEISNDIVVDTIILEANT